MQVKETVPQEPDSSSSRTSRWLRMEALLFLALAQVLWAGYQLGAGNQSIQIPFLQHWLDPTLYPHDLMVTSTVNDYPSFFFRALARLVGPFDLATTYFALHLLTAFTVLVAVNFLASAIFGDRWSGPVVVLLLLAGHHQALAGEVLYSPGFTHTWAVFPFAIGALALLYRDRHFAAFALAGVLFNVHALTAGYLAVMFGFWVLCECRSLGWKTIAGLLAVFTIAASPTLIQLIAHAPHFDAEWIRLTLIRSANHSFPSSWWAANDPSLPRFLLIAGLGVLSLSFPAPERQQRKTLLLWGGIAGLFMVGYLFSEILPLPMVLRAQLFRSSRLFLVIALALTAHSLVCGWRMAFAKNTFSPRWRAWLEFANATFVFLCLALPGLTAFLPVAFTLATIVAVVNGRLSGLQALFASMVLLGCVAASRMIQFPLLGSVGHSLSNLASSVGSAGLLFWLALLGALLLWLASQRMPRTRLQWLAGAVGIVAFAVLATTSYTTTINQRESRDAWVQIQDWARNNTPVDALFLTPTLPGGFRIHSQRSVVCEWRDGTQAFFNPDFANQWWERLNALNPGLLYDSTGRRLLAKGKPLGELDDVQLVALSSRYNATHIVLPSDRKRNLVCVASNSAWAVYRPEFPATLAPTGKELLDKDRWKAQDRFLHEVVLPNIEKYRKSDATIQIVDPNGRPLAGLPVEVRQTRQAFDFECSLPFFITPPGDPMGDFKPPPVTEAELNRFLEIFNSSLIPYSGKWLYIEPEEGKRQYDDLDRYVDWCTAHGIEMEFHFLSGYAPAWLRKKPAAEQGQLFLNHARDLVTRYGKRIRYWQVVNENHLMQYAPPVFEEIRRIAPEARLGISDCSRFYSPDKSPDREKDMMRGLKEVRWLQGKGIKLDYFAFHGHRPFGVWPDARDMYEALDGFAREGVKIHISEFAVAIDPQTKIIGPLRSGTWTPELQAEFYERFYTVCFSHPAVEAINLWSIGPVSWQNGSGLLDKDYQPKPAFLALKELIQHRWRTQFSGKLGIDGAISFRGFHGDYELRLTLPSAESVRTTISIKPDGPNTYRLCFDARKGTLETAR